MSTAGQLQISVVVASRNRSHLLHRLFHSLEEQMDAPPFEVVIVDDSSNDSTAAVLSELARTTSLDVRLLRTDRQSGPATARNIGWRAAQAPIVAFTDDDCIPQPMWLAAMARAMNGHDLVQGSTRPNPDQRWGGPFSRVPRCDHENGLYETCNMAYRVSALRRVGGFDEHFGAVRRSRSTDYTPPVWGEDTDLAWRVKESGGSSHFAGDALVWHDWKPGGLRHELGELRRRPPMVLVVKRHPQARVAFEPSWAIDRAHPPALVSAGLLALAITRPRRGLRWIAAAAGILAWMPHRSAQSRRRNYARSLLRYYVADVASAALMGAASVRHRTLLL